MDEPLCPDDARRLIRAILACGGVLYSRHAEIEMSADGLGRLDCDLALRSGAVQPGEFERGTWRDRVETKRIVVVIAFRFADEIVVVTAWRCSS